jgi:hypothetical protein
MTPVQKRRRNVLMVLGGAAIASLLTVLVVGNPILWIVQVLADVLLVAYVLMLIHFNRQGLLAALQDDLDTWPPASRPVRPLAHPKVPPRPELAPLSPEDSSAPRAAAR